MDDLRIEHWASAAARGDRQAVDSLYEYFSPSLFGYMADMTDPETAEDLLHELWLKALQKLGSRKGPARPWLFAVARNLSIDALRGTRIHVALDAERDEADESSEPVEPREERERLRLAVHRLPMPARDVVLMRHYSGLPLKTIARMLDIPIGTVASRLRSALAMLQKELYCETRPAS